MDFWCSVEHRRVPGEGKRTLFGNERPQNLHYSDEWEPAVALKRVYKLPIRGAAMNARRVFLTGVLALAVSFLGCGSSDYTKNVMVTVSPATANVAANGKVRLTATVSGLCTGCAPEIDSWGITEDAQPGDPNGFGCQWFTINGPPTPIQCPAGTIEETGGGLSNSLTATYHASARSGTYHVVAMWGGLYGLPTKTGTSVITVTQ